mmetsp:Transcript_16459/g.43101  ORF Transcript_16459/g.43101 Transcript_16459/m.43101 type:complete len:228 (+) Transcript_16459:1509-2192(+)
MHTILPSELRTSVGPPLASHSLQPTPFALPRQLLPSQSHASGMLKGNSSEVGLNFLPSPAPALFAASLTCFRRLPFSFRRSQAEVSSELVSISPAELHPQPAQMRNLVGLVTLGSNGPTPGLSLFLLGFAFRAADMAFECAASVASLLSCTFCSAAVTRATHASNALFAVSGILATRSLDVSIVRNASPARPARAAITVAEPFQSTESWPNKVFKASFSGHVAIMPM